MNQIIHRVDQLFRGNRRQMNEPGGTLSGGMQRFDSKQLALYPQLASAHDKETDQED